jgi:hypothetical protein
MKLSISLSSQLVHFVILPDVVLSGRAHMIRSEKEIVSHLIPPSLLAAAAAAI